jgi:hypothetical protein
MHQVRSDEELGKIGDAFATNPHEVYETMKEMSHESLSLLAMQLLSRCAAPLTGPSSSSRVGASAIQMRRQRVALNYSLPSQSNSLLAASQSNRSLMSFQLAGRRRVTASAHPHSRNPLGTSPQHQPNSSLTTTSSDHRHVSISESTPGIEVTCSDVGGGSGQRANSVSASALLESLLEDVDVVRRMSTHELEQGLKECGLAIFEERMVPLNQIFFYQDYICNQFMEGRFLTDTIRQLQRGEVTPETLPRMDCLYYNNRWYGMGNRRLACFHYVYRLEPTRMIPVRALVIPKGQQLFPQGDGLTVKLGGGHFLDGYMMFTMKHCTAWSSK